MRRIPWIASHVLGWVGVGLLPATAAMGQQSGAKVEFEAASIRANPPRVGFHFGDDSSMEGGPGSANPELFRCSKCTMSGLIVKAFNLQPYQFPGRSAMSDDTFEVMARIPAGTTQEQFLTMLQNLLKDRFGLAFHYTDKSMRGYQLTVGKNGPKLKPSGETGAATARADSHAASAWSGGSHKHDGLVSFGGSATYRGERKTIGDLARVLSDQLGVPVDDQTGLPGKYDILLAWSGNAASENRSHGGGGGSDGGAGHGDHGGGGVGSGPRSGDGPGGPGLAEALQSQLGLRLVRSEQATARMFVVDHVEKAPAAN